MGNCVCIKKMNKSPDLIINDLHNTNVPKKKIINYSSNSNDFQKSKLTNYSDTEKPVVESNEKVMVDNINNYISTFSYKNKEKSSKLKKNDSLPQIISCETYNYHLNVLVCGDSGVGKSALMIRYTENEFDRFHIVSIAVEYGSKVLKNKGKIFKLNFFVAPGDPAYTQDITSLYNQADCILFVFDFTNKLSFTSVINSRERLLRNEKKESRHYVVGNKCESKSKDYFSLDCKNYCENSKIQYFEISAKNNINIDKMFLKICENFSKEMES